MDTIHVGDLKFEVVRSARRKTVEIGIERDGSLILRAPEGISEQRLERFATQKRMWVHRKLALKRALAGAAPRKEYVSGEGFRYLGRSYRLQLVADQEVPLKLVEGRFRIARAETGKCRERFVAWYTAHARPWLTRRVGDWTPRVAPSEVRVEVLDLGFRWGSCGRGGRLNFNWATITLPPAIIDYVIVHELAHLRHQHHGPAFWATVARAMPDHRERRRWLAEHGSEHGL